jgi:hypothetical protein
VTSISFLPPSDSNLKPLHGSAEILSPYREMIVSRFEILICISGESVHNVSSSHQGKEMC